MTTQSEHPALIAFRQQSPVCREGGSPLSALILDVLAADFVAGGPVHRIAKGWGGRAIEDALTLRLIGGLHRLVLDGSAPNLAKHYPSVGGSPTESLATDVIQTVSDFEAVLRIAVTQQVQTNEVGRSNALLGGFLAIAELTPKPMLLLEIGSSAGLNLFWDLFSYSNETFEWNAIQRDVVLKTDWSGSAPACLSVEPVIVGRAGCDLMPIDIHDDDACRSLESFIWPDQPERLARLRGAIRIARENEYRLEKADAGPWLTKELAEPADGQCKVIFHSIMWDYLPKTMQDDVTAQITQAGELATESALVAWLRLELERPSVYPMLKLTLWPGGQELTLGTAHFHGAWVKWSKG
ncbi:MAG: DUF2332 family protein [Alphaproteobacteria bacterium]|nr:DUF2332 family protein [Alphaproteobacteria bacterium]